MMVQLQYLRAIAALLVVYFHAALQMEKVDLGTAPTLHLLGESGVDLFFVLSGFMMWLTTAGKPVGTLDFFWRRVRRIVPLYWAATLFAATVALIAPSLLKSTVFDIRHVVSSLFFVPMINPATEMITPVVVPGWTLNYEMYFYFVFGLCLLLPQKFRLQGLLGLIGGVFLLCNLLPQVTVTRFYGYQIIFEFVIGVLLGYLYTRGFRLPLAGAILLMIAGFSVLLYNDYIGVHVARLLRVGLPAAAVVLAAISISLPDRSSWRWLRVLGDASYSIYLTHAFTLAGMRVVHPHLPGVLSEEIPFLLLMIGFSTIGGLLSYYLFEVPVGNALAKLKWRKPAPERPAVRLPAGKLATEPGHEN